MSRKQSSDAIRAGVSLREFAAACGRSHVWVKIKCDEGLIPRYDDGSIPLEEGLAAFRKIGPATIGRPKKGTKKTTKKPVTIPTPKPEPEPEEEDEELMPEPEPTPVSTSLASGTSAAIAQAFNKAKLAEKTYQAKLRELEYKLRKGELIERAEVEADATAVGTEIRDRLTAMAARVAGRCEGRPAREIEAIIQDGVNEALRSLKSSKFKGG